MLSYSLLERIHYLLVAGFDGTAISATSCLCVCTWTSCAWKGEFTFLVLLPHAERERIHAYWYRGATPQAQLFLRAAQAEATPETTSPTAAANRSARLYGLLNRIWPRCWTPATILPA